MGDNKIFMRQFTILFAIFCAAIIACQKSGPEVNQPSETGILTVDLTERLSSKAAFETVYDSEKAIRFANIYVYNEAGNLIASRYLPEGISSASMSCAPGIMTVVAIVNHTPSDFAASNLSTVSKEIVSMESYPDIDSGLPMYACSSCKVIAGSDISCSLTCTRLHSRVVLRSVKNAAMYEITLKNIFLSNVQTLICLDASEVPVPRFINKEGRDRTDSANGSYAIIDGISYMAEIPDMTFKEIDKSIGIGTTYAPQNPYMFYCFRNGSEVDPNGYHSNFSPQRTVLVLTIDIAGKDYYYPVVLASDKGIQPNHTYTVDVSVSGPGSNDPNDIIHKSDIGISITTSRWNDGTPVSETI